MQVNFHGSIIQPHLKTKSKEMKSIKHFVFKALLVIMMIGTFKAINAQTIISGIQRTTPFITPTANATAAIVTGSGIVQVPTSARGSITFGSLRPRGFAADGATANVDSAISKKEYVQFEVSPATGFDLNITGITLRGNGTLASATNFYAVAMAIGDSTLFSNGGATYLDSAGATGNVLYTSTGYLVNGADTIGQNIAVNNGSRIYLRIYMWNASRRTSTSQFTITNFVISGSVTASKATFSTSKAIICNGDSYLFNGNTYSTTGSYTAHLTNSAGADSAATLNLTVAPPATTKTTSLIGCGSVNYKGKAYTKSTVFIDTTKSSLGCDSILNTVTVTISCVPVISSFTPTFAANGDSVTIIGGNFSTATAISFGGTKATGFIIVNDTTIKAAVGVGTSGNVSVTNTSGTGLLAGFTYNTANIIKGIQTTSPFIAAGLNVTSGISHGSGLLQTPTTRGGNIVFGTRTPRGFAADGTTAIFDTAVAKNQYVQFAVSPAIGYNMAINGITIKGNGTVAITTNNYAVAYAIGDSILFNTGGATFLDSAGSTGNILYRTVGYLASGADTTGQNIAVNNGSTIYVRVYMWNNSATPNNSQFTITNFTMIGKVTADASSSITKETICNGSSYIFNGVSYSKAGTYTAHLKNSLGGDSTAVLELKVTAPATTKTVNLIGCGSVTYKGNVYSKATTFIDTLKSFIGCDSIYNTVNVTISCVPIINSFTPTTAAISDTVTIIGINFTGASAVSFGGTAAASFTVVDDTTILAIVGNGTTGVVSVTTPNGIVTANGFVYNTANIVTGIRNATPFITAGKNVVTGLTYGTGILQVPAGARRTITFGTNRPRGFAADGVTANIDTAIAKGEYVQFAVSPATGYKMDINGITIKGNGTVANTTNHYAIAYAVGDSTLFDNGKATYLDSAGSAGNILYTTTDYLVKGSDTTGLSIKVNNTSKLYLRVYLWGASARTNNSQFTLSTFTMYGSVVSAATSSTLDTSICAGTNITFNGVTYDTAGTYTAHLINSQSADSAAHLVLTIKKTSTSTTRDSICAGGSVKFNGSTYTKSGTYTAHLTNAVGCDSTATLILTVKATSTSTTRDTICNNSSVKFNGSFYSKTGTYTAHLTNSVGCDSTATLIVTVKDTSSSITRDSVCANSSYTFNGSVYSKAGTYIAHLTNAAGCDSTAVLVLSLITPKTVSVIINSPQTDVCSGNQVIINAFPTNGGSAAVYQWSVNGSTVPFTQSSFAYIPPYTGQAVIICKMISSENCVVADTVSSNPLPISITATTTASVSIASVNNGTTETFTASVINGGSAPMYSWYKNNVLVSIGNSTYTDSVLVTGDSVYCVVASNLNCVINPSVTSNVLLVTNPLPLSLTSFTVATTGSNNVLKWNTANEVSTASFAVQSSKNGSIFSDIAAVSAKGTSLNTYSYTDKNAAYGATYYRLKMLDKTGKFTYSNVVEAGVKAANSFAIYPNPVHSALHLQVSSTKAGAGIVQVIDVLGRVLVSQQVQLSIGTNNLTVPVLAIANGSYRVVLKGETVAQQQFIKN